MYINNDKLNMEFCSRPTVEDQLADLTRLLHTAMHSDEEDSGYSEKDRPPGKLNQNVIDNLVQLSEDNYSKSPTKSSLYAPTALLEAKKREIENPVEDQQQHFRYDSVFQRCMYSISRFFILFFSYHNSTCVCFFLFFLACILVTLINWVKYDIKKWISSHKTVCIIEKLYESNIPRASLI